MTMSDNHLYSVRAHLLAAIALLDGMINQDDTAQLAHLRKYLPTVLPMRARELYFDIQSELKTNHLPVPNQRECALLLTRLGYRQQKRAGGVYWQP